jgi:hypothetical protein
VATPSAVLVGFESVHTLDLVGPWEVLAMAGPDHYSLRIPTLGGASLEPRSGARLKESDNKPERVARLGILN